MATLNEMILDTIKTSSNKTPKYFAELMQGNSFRLVPDTDSKKWIVYENTSNARIYYHKKRGAEPLVFVCLGWKRNLTKKENDFLKVNLLGYLDRELYQLRCGNKKYFVPVECEYRRYQRCPDGHIEFRYIFNWEIKHFKNLTKWRTYSYEPLDSIYDMKKNLRQIKLNKRDIECNYGYIETCEKRIKEFETEITEMNRENCSLWDKNKSILNDARERRVSKSAKVS